ncbi:hypothetical protein GCM10007063_12310 [Lentibacillus kapialis]|uniref:Uncharacterized protein n=1 Tax=Lentibacillus kapialis TaxID=340214 RepID=A0A917PTL5_9BACI|nr:hypothetical protein GCM10007063_12310 [Lentibacillus kapialis]
MIGLLIAITIFNLFAFITNQRLTQSQIVHIWMFTIAFQVLTDLMIDDKYHGYWYFDEATGWNDLLTLTVLIPPVNMIFLNWYPFRYAFSKQCVYLVVWVIAITLYELVTLLPEPWGYFHHGWWRIWYSLAVNPFLLAIVVLYYQWIYKIEKTTIG